MEASSPLYVGYRHFSEHAPWMKAHYKGQILDNSSFDQTAVLYAVRNGVGEYWEEVKDGYCEADDKGGNIWIKKEKSNHRYLTLTMDPELMASLIESIMLNTY
jgi:SH3-like domain-containing protein